ncbi:hypothetical protein U1Q18_051661, partial [Sarracenia purpurea var. burkii]
MQQTNGVIQTPNFPQPFAVPIRCRWVIDATNHSDPTIYVYFTQLFVTTGLKISEYMLYDEGVGYNGRTIFDLPSRDSFKFKPVGTNHSYMVIDFELYQLE